MNRRISGEPRLADYISRALEPHIESIEDWNKEDFVALFFGFGNLTLETPARYVFRQTFWRISVDICLALDELGFGDLDYEERDFYYSITSAFSNLSYPHHAPEGAPQPAEGVIHMRADLFKAVENTSCRLIPLEGYKFELVEGFGKQLRGELE